MGSDLPELQEPYRHLRHRQPQGLGPADHLRHRHVRQLVLLRHPRQRHRHRQRNFSAPARPGLRVRQRPLHVLGPDIVERFWRPLLPGRLERRGRGGVRRRVPGVVAPQLQQLRRVQQSDGGSHVLREPGGADEDGGGGADA